MILRIAAISFCLLSISGLLRCGSNVAGKDEETSGPFTVGGTLTGLEGTLTLQINGGNALELDSDGDFTFSPEFETGEDYDVQISSYGTVFACEVKKGSGTVEDENVTTVKIECQDPWVHPSGLTDNFSINGTDGSSSDVAMDNQGNSIIASQQFDSFTILQTYKSEFRNGSWDHPDDLLESISGSGINPMEASLAKVAMADNGDAVIVWNQSDGFDSQIFMSERRLGIWSTEVVISPAGTEALGQEVAMDDDGNTVIVWSQQNGMGRFHVFLSEYRVGSGWTHPANINDHLSTGPTDAFSAKPSLTNGGHGLIAWQQSDGSNEQVFVSVYDGMNWPTPSSSSDNLSPDGEDVQHLASSLDENGDGFVVWSQDDGAGEKRVFFSEYRNNVWANPIDLNDATHIASPPGGEAFDPSLSMSANGDAILAWRQSNPDGEGLYLSEYRDGSWSHPSGLSDDVYTNLGTINEISSALNDLGNAVVAWIDEDGLGTKRVFFTERRNGIWRHEIQEIALEDAIGPVPANDVFYLDTAMDDEGQAIIVWNQLDDEGFNQAFKSEYRP